MNLVLYCLLWNSELPVEVMHTLLQRLQTTDESKKKRLKTMLILPWCHSSKYCCLRSMFFLFPKYCFSRYTYWYTDAHSYVCTTLLKRNQVESRSLLITDDLFLSMYYVMLEITWSIHCPCTYINFDSRVYRALSRVLKHIHVIVRVYLSLSSRLRDLRERAKREPVVS